MARELDFCPAKLALFQLCIQPLLPELSQDKPDVFCVLGRVPGINQVVIWINNDVLIKQVLEHVIHESLEYCQGITEAEGHD